MISTRFLKSAKVLVWLILLIFYSFVLLRPINLVTADLGRHIKNGELVWQTLGILKTNFYSYTYPDFSFVNHHWLSGVIFYFIWLLAGFVGLEIFFWLISLITFSIFFYLGARKSSATVLLALGLACLPLLAIRTEIRPEMFSYLFFAVSLLFWTKFKEGRLTFKKLCLILLALQVLWVNLHILFILGPIIAAIFALADLIRKGWRNSLVKKQWLLVPAIGLISLLNPSGIRGMFLPATIWRNYGYRILENQTIWFLDKVLPQPSLTLFKILFLIWLLSFLSAVVIKRRLSWANLLLSVVIWLLAWGQFKNLALFSFCLLALAAQNLETVLSHFRSDRLVVKSTVVTIAAVLLFTFGQVGTYFNSIGFGLYEKNQSAANFFKDQNIQGPIFNNYDIGGYLIFYLWPKKVFVDNRPEAYPASFFQNVYIPMQEQEAVWQEQSRQYNFNAIVFGYRDRTPWAQNFLGQRLSDSSWAPVWADQWVLILLRRNELNQSIIDRFEIPKSAFNFKAN